MNNKYTKQTFIEHLKKAIEGSDKTFRDLIDWKMVAKSCGIHYQSLLTYLRGNGPDEKVMDCIIENALQQTMLIGVFIGDVLSNYEVPEDFDLVES